ncbi:hypothetical protein [Nocardiopsis alborubida]|uniref:Uncharacterized protein n=1 Tax=Nocardiopsis alborubida TaxID=146802 RepID=A0A7X6MI15_9ACTN|nr:hypothetical protein [Nocardiopsis alborubida]NKZ00094.1 hypothetical protein [Nocardiopsis alborubida]
MPSTSPLPPTASYTHSKATRLLCAGAYLDPEFRETAITELIEHPERTVPPSLGYDVATVLRHCLRARSMDMKAASLVLAIVIVLVVWGLVAGSLRIESLVALFSLINPPDFLILFDATDPPELTDQENSTARAMGTAALISLALFAFVGLFSRRRQKLLGRSAPFLTASGRRTTGPVSRGRRFRALVLALLNLALTVLWILFAYSFLGAGHVPVALALLSPPALLLAIGVWHQLDLSRVLWTELTRHSFTGTSPEVAPSLFTKQRAGTMAAIDREQFSRLILYNEDDPFLGAGDPYRPWSLALELERRPDTPDSAKPLDGRRVLDLITPRLAKLAEVSSRTSRDRLKDMELQECVLLPAALPTDARRAKLPYGDGNIRRHLEEATGEGAEQRRHFLRIRVGGWGEEVVTTVFVRVHTQGDLLILEVLPYVLPPLRSAFHEVDTLTERSTRFRMSALVAAPAMTMTVLARGTGTLRSWWFEWRGPAGGRAQRAPQLSVRELGSRGTRSMLQEMDVKRYVKTIQDRITSGAHQALAEAGYKTEEFQQQVVNISRGGVFIGGSMTGSIATGASAQAVTGTDPTATAKEEDKR